MPKRSVRTTIIPARTAPRAIDTSVLRSIATVTPAAEAYLREHPLLADLAERNACILRDLKAEGAPFTAITVEKHDDPEIRDLTAIVFDVNADGDLSEVKPWDEQLRRRRLAFEDGLSANARDANLLNIIVHLSPATVRDF